MNHQINYDCHIHMFRSILVTMDGVGSLTKILRMIFQPQLLAITVWQTAHEGKCPPHIRSRAQQYLVVFCRALISGLSIVLHSQDSYDQAPGPGTSIQRLYQRNWPRDFSILWLTISLHLALLCPTSP